MLRFTGLILLFLFPISAIPLDSAQCSASRNKSNTSQNDFGLADSFTIHHTDVHAYNSFEFCAYLLSLIRHGDNDERIIWTGVETSFRMNESECVIQWGRTSVINDLVVTRAATALEEQCFPMWNQHFLSQQGIIDVESLNRDFKKLRYTLRRDFLAEGGQIGTVQAD